MFVWDWSFPSRKKVLDSVVECPKYNWHPAAFIHLPKVRNKDVCVVAYILVHVGIGLGGPGWYSVRSGFLSGGEKDKEDTNVCNNNNDLLLMETRKLVNNLPCDTCDNNPYNLHTAGDSH